MSKRERQVSFYVLPISTFIGAAVVGALSHLTTIEIVSMLNAHRSKADHIDPLFWYPGKWSSVKREYLASGLNPKLLGRRSKLSVLSFGLFLLGLLQLLIWHAKFE